MTDPAYTGLQKDQIPAFPADDGRVTVNLISGTWDGHNGPFQSLTGVEMMTLAFRKGGRIELPVESGRTIFLYVVRGELTIAGQTAPEMHLIELNDDGDAVELVALTDALVLFGHAKPFREPVVAHGPFVMNTREEIVQAMRDYQAGMFR
jgi:redox-sensitive bicupin YhaK (pirin superfamily)